MIEEIQARRRGFGLALLLLLLWVALFTVLTHLFSVSYIFTYFQPYTFLETFLLQFIPCVWPILLLLVITSLLGWILLRSDKKIGRILLLISQITVLAFDAFITPLHLFNEMGYFNAVGGRTESNFNDTLVLALCGAVYPVLALILMNKWKPQIK